MVASALVETWVLYAVATCIIILRIFTRAKMVGMRHFKPDDYLVVVSWVSAGGSFVAILCTDNLQRLSTQA